MPRRRYLFLNVRVGGWRLIWDRHPRLYYQGREHGRHVEWWPFKLRLGEFRTKQGWRFASIDSHPFRK